MRDEKVSLGWDQSARPERVGARYGEKIFQQKNTFGGLEKCVAFLSGESGQ